VENSSFSKLFCESMKRKNVPEKNRIRLNANKTGNEYKGFPVDICS
jgi:hypothetical protein